MIVSKTYFRKARLAMTSAWASFTEVPSRLKWLLIMHRFPKRNSQTKFLIDMQQTRQLTNKLKTILFIVSDLVTSDPVHIHGVFRRANSKMQLQNSISTRYEQGRGTIRYDRSHHITGKHHLCHCFKGIAFSSSDLKTRQNQNQYSLVVYNIHLKWVQIMRYKHTEKMFHWKIANNYNL